MINLASDDLLSAMLAAVFVWAGALNVVGPAFIRSEFRSWGYSDGLRVTVGAVEWIAAVALLISVTRVLGCALAAAILLGVLATLLRHGERMRLEYPLVLFLLMLWIGARTINLI